MHGHTGQPASSEGCTPLATYREQGILRRLSTTPVPPSWILGAQLAVHLCIAATALVILMVVGTAGFGLRSPASLGGFVLGVVLSMIATFGIGLWITGVARNARDAGESRGSSSFRSCSSPGCGSLARNSRLACGT